MRILNNIVYFDIVTAYICIYIYVYRYINSIVLIIYIYSKLYNIIKKNYMIKNKYLNPKNSSKNVEISINWR